MSESKSICWNLVNSSALELKTESSLFVKALLAALLVLWWFRLAFVAPMAALSSFVKLLNHLSIVWRLAERSPIGGLSSKGDCSSSE